MCITNSNEHEEMIDEMIHCKIFYVTHIEAKVTEVNKAHWAMSKATSDGKLNSARQSPGVKIAHVLRKFLSSITNESSENMPDTSCIPCPDDDQRTNVGVEHLSSGRKNPSEEPFRFQQSDKPIVCEGWFSECQNWNVRENCRPTTFLKQSFSAVDSQVQKK